MNTKKAYTRWGIYTSIFVFVLLCVPAIVAAQGGPGTSPPTGGPPEPGLIRCDTDCDFTDFMDLIKRVIDFLLYVISIPVATILFVYAGFLYMTAAGDTGQINKATGIFKNVAWGFIIALSAWLMVNLLTTTLLKGSPSATDVIPTSTP